MKVMSSIEEIRVITLRQEAADPDYGSCLWMNIYLDIENGILMCVSDVGNFAYRWPEKGKMFLKILSTVTEDYLLGKCSEMTELDTERTKARFTDWILDWGDDDVMDLTYSKDEYLEELQSCETAQDFEGFAEEYGIDDWWEMLRYDYDPLVRRFAKMFRKYAQPEIREIQKAMEEPT